MLAKFGVTILAVLAVLVAVTVASDQSTFDKMV